MFIFVSLNMKRFSKSYLLLIYLLIWWKMISAQVMNSADKEHLSSSPTVLGSSSPPTVVVERGKQTRLKCIYSAKPEPKIHWLKEAKEIRHDCGTCISSVKNDADSKTSFLDITPYEDKDYGEYECRIRNKYGSAKLKILLKKADNPQTKCEKERATSQDPRKRNEFNPVCNDDGSYHEVQCSIELTTCWCVNKHGKKTLDVISGVDGLQCFTPKDLSVIAILVLTQGIIMTLVMVDQLVNIYTGYGIATTIRKYYKKRINIWNGGYKLLKKEDRKTIKRRPLPAIPVQKRVKRK